MEILLEPHEVIFNFIYIYIYDLATASSPTLCLPAGVKEGTQPVVRSRLRTREVNINEGKVSKNESKALSLTPASCPTGLYWNWTNWKWQDIPDSSCTQDWPRQLASVPEPVHILLRTGVHPAADHYIPLLPAASTCWPRQAPAKFALFVHVLPLPKEICPSPHLLCVCGSGVELYGLGHQGPAHLSFPLFSSIAFYRNHCPLPFILKPPVSLSYPCPN